MQMAEGRRGIITRRYKVKSVSAWSRLRQCGSAAVLQCGSVAVRQWRSDRFDALQYIKTQFTDQVGCDSFSMVELLSVDNLRLLSQYRNAAALHACPPFRGVGGHPDPQDPGSRQEGSPSPGEDRCGHYAEQQQDHD